MSWEAVSAIASIASAFIVLVAAFAAVQQLRHMRLANQLSSFFQVMAWIQSAEGIEARRFLASLDLGDRATLQ
jgi:Flp pilus assembly protein protease CpaA